MDFTIPEEMKMLRGLVRDFVRDQLRPLERDLLGRSAGLADARACLPPEDEERLQKLAGEVGLWGLGVPGELGGAGLGALGQCLAAEEAAQTIVPFNFGDVTPLLFECTPEQRRRYFEPHFRRRRQAMVALLEPEGLPGFPGLRATAAREGGHYVISGAKVSFSRPGPDPFAIVFATTASAPGPGEAPGAGGAPPGGLPAASSRASSGGPGQGPGATAGPGPDGGHSPRLDQGPGAGPGPTAFLVDADTPGFTLAGAIEPTGWRSQLRAPLSLALEGCRVPEASILGGPGQAYHLGKRWLPVRRLVRGARCVGVGLRLLEEARLRVESWQSFGQQVFRRPGVESALADIAVSLHACRLLVLEAACKADAAVAAAAAASGGGTGGAGAAGLAGAGPPGGALKREAAMVKLFATRTLRAVADRVSLLYDGPPCVQGLPLQRLCADALAASAADLALALQSSIITADIMKGLKV